MTDVVVHPSGPSGVEPRCGALAPAFSLPNALAPDEAAPIQLRHWRQRQPVLLVLLPDASAPQSFTWLTAVSERYAEIVGEAVAVMAVVAAAREQAYALCVEVGARYPILVDTAGKVISTYLGAGPLLPALALIDRYSVLIALQPANDERAAPDLDTALREFAFASQEDCACGLPIWDE